MTLRPMTIDTLTFIILLILLKNYHLDIKTSKRKKILYKCFQSYMVKKCSIHLDFLYLKIVYKVKVVYKVNF